MNDMPPPPVQPTPAPAATATPVPGQKPTAEQMRDALKEVFDPEIPINIVDLGLIYRLEEKDGKVDVDMTLTSPGCPVAEQLKASVTGIITKQPGITVVNVNVVFDPTWTKDKMTFDGKLQAQMLGIM